MAGNPNPSKRLTKEAIAKAQTPEAKAKRAKTIEQKRTTKLLKTQVYEALTKSLTAEQNKKNNKLFFESFIETFLAKALKDPDSQAARMIASGIFTPEILDNLDKAANSAMDKDLDFLRYRLLKNAFTEQRDVILDTHTTKKQCAMCSRRAGKTDMISTLVNYIAITPNSPMFYIGLTFSTAIAQVFDLVLERSELAGISIEKSSKVDGTIEFSNGSVLNIRGNSSVAEQEKLRGFKARLVIIDEAQSQRNLKYLLNDIIGPLLLDYRDSVLILSGTPPRIPKTYFEQAWLGSEYKNYHWTMKENPFIEDVDAVIDGICEAKGLTRESPLIQREYLGMLAYDVEAQVMKDYKTYKPILTVTKPNGDLVHTPPVEFVADKAYVGVDFGFSDYNAVIAVAVNTTTKQSYIIYEAKFNRATVSEIILSTRQALEETKATLVKNPLADIGSIQILCDNSDKSIAYEMSQTYGLPANTAWKYDKQLAIEQLAEDCRTGRMLVPEGGILHEEFDMTLYKRGEDDTILPDIDDALFHPDALFALLYASRSVFLDFGYDTGHEGKEL